MTIVDELNQIANRFAELGLEVPETAIVGEKIWHEILFEISQHRGPMDNSDVPKCVSFMHLHGYCTIKPNSEVHPNHISIGRMTLTDIIVEDILLDDEVFTDIYNSN